MADAENFAERVKTLREQTLRLSQRELAAQLDVSAGLIGQIETGKAAPSPKVLQAFERTFRINPEWLLKGEDPMLLQLTQAFRTSNRLIEPPDYSMPMHGDLVMDGQDYAFVKRVALSISAGNGLMPVDGDDAETIALPTRWFARQRIAADLTVLVSVKGDSMAPGIPDGALVLLSVVDKLLIKQGIYAFNLDGQSYVKRILPSQLGPDGRPQALLLVSDNLAYPPIAVSGPDMNAITWIGRVRAVLTTL
jgi:phage repressor protein C with HTH and peptisase S24 domain